MQNIYFFVIFVIIIIIVTILGKPIPLLSQQTDDHLQVHIHVPLTIIVNGKEYPLPADIGIAPQLWKDHTFDRYSDNPEFYSALHTHHYDKIIHVESTALRSFTLGNFLDVWGVDENTIKNVISDTTNITNYKNLPLRNGQNLTIEMNIETSPENFTEYVDSISGLPFQYPSEWNLTILSNVSQSFRSALGETFLNLIILSPSESNYLGTPYFSIEIDKLPSNNITLDQYAIANLPLVFEANENRFPKLIEQFPVNYNDNYARQIVLNINNILKDEDDYRSNVTTTEMQIWTVKNDKVYIVSYNAYSSAYFDYIPTITKIINSIKID